MADIVISEELVARDELSVDEQIKEDRATEAALIRLRYRILAQRAVLKAKKDAERAANAGMERRMTRDLKALTR